MIFTAENVFLPDMRDSVTNPTASDYSCESSFLVTVPIHFYDIFDLTRVHGTPYFSDSSLLDHYH